MDFYLIDYVVVIEYNGKQHYAPSTFGNLTQEQAQLRLNNQKERDTFVDSFCALKNIKIYWIDGRKYKGENLKIYLEELLKNIGII